MKDYIRLGIDKGLISFNEDKSRITYINKDKERNYNNPEERVQAETFLRLIIDYHYPDNRIRQYVPVTMGSEVKEADDCIAFANHLMSDAKAEVESMIIG